MIAIRREDKNAWERRVALTPAHVARLVGCGIGVSVETSPDRAFVDIDYRSAGATVADSTGAARVVLGIKEIPIPRLRPDTTYLFFSHTTKGQAHNMPMLRRLMDLGCTLIDYEQITDAAGRRLIFFGRHAGHAGMIDGLWALGQRLAADGFRTPLADVQPAHRYDGLAAALRHLDEVGGRLADGGWPEPVAPLVCGITGTGNVSRGAREVLDHLPIVELTPDELLRGAHDRRDVVYAVTLDLEQRFRHVDGGAVTIAELSAHPERFENGALPYLSRLSILVNGMFWVPELPRLLPLDDLRRMRRSGELAGLRVISDISCDIDGAIEATYKATTPDAPVFVYDVTRERYVDGIEGDGPVILAVDNLPAELPRESSQDFGDTLLPFVEPLARCDWERPLDQLDLPEELRRAILVHRGRLTPRFAHLAEPLAAQGSD